MHRMLLLCMCFCFPVLVYADSFSFILPVSSLAADQEITVTASISGLQEGNELYIKGAFYKQGSSNYFGYTKFDDVWIKNSAATKNQKKVTIGIWNYELIVRPDFQDSGFSGDGEYFFKVGYYSIDTEGNPSQVKWSDTFGSIHLTAPTPTPVPIKTPRPTETPKPAFTATPNPSLGPLPTIIPADIQVRIQQKNTPVHSRNEVLGYQDIQQLSLMDEKESIEVKSTQSSPTTVFVSDNATQLSISSVSAVESTFSGTQDNPLILSFLLIGSGLAVLAVVSIISKIWEEKEES